MYSLNSNLQQWCRDNQPERSLRRSLKGNGCGLVREASLISVSDIAQVVRRQERAVGIPRRYMQCQQRVLVLVIDQDAHNSKHLLENFLVPSEKTRASDLSAKLELPVSAIDYEALRIPAWTEWIVDGVMVDHLAFLQLVRKIICNEPVLINVWELLPCILLGCEKFLYLRIPGSEFYALGGVEMGLSFREDNGRPSGD